MDNLTHTLFAATLARTPLGRVGGGATTALLVASNIPDLDIVAAARGGAAAYFHWHRGPTHGLLGVLGLGLLSAAFASAVAHTRAGRGGQAPAPFRTLLMLGMVGVLFHVGMDLPTSYGTRLLSPFDWHWFAVDWMPIVDIYLIVILAAALLFGSMSPGARRRNAAIALLLMALNYGVRAAAHQRAIDVAPAAFGPTLPRTWCDQRAASASGLDRWPRDWRIETTERCVVEIAAMPSFVSPFRWRLIAQRPGGYDVLDIDLLDRKWSNVSDVAAGSWRRVVRFPNVWTPAVRAAATSPAGELFLGFARFPRVRTATDGSGVTTVRWNDVRFAGGILSVEQRSERPQPFTAAARVSADGQLLESDIER